MSALRLVVPSAVVLSYVAFGLTGFRVVIPLVATLGFPAALTLGIREPRLAATRESRKRRFARLCEPIA